MRFQIIFNIILSVSLLNVAHSWSCSQVAKAMPLVASQVSGVWYEIARLGSNYVLACVKVTVPESQINDNYTLELDYINKVNNGWNPTKQSLVFPWTEAASGNFNLHYSAGALNTNLKFKYLGTMNDYCVVCGYTDLAPAISMVQILSRNKLVNNTVKTELFMLAQLLHIKLPELTWVQQDGRCNGADDCSTFNVGVLVALCFIQMVLKYNMWAR